MVDYLVHKQKMEEDGIDSEEPKQPYQVDKIEPFKFAIPAENILRIIVKAGKLDQFI